MLYLAAFELREGDNEYTDFKFIQSESEELAMFAAEEYLSEYFGEDGQTERLDDKWVMPKCGYPIARFWQLIPVNGMEDVIDRLSYIGEKPELDKHVYCVTEDDIDEAIKDFQEEEQVELTPEQRQLVIGLVADWETWDDIDWNIRAVLNQEGENGR